MNHIEASRKQWSVNSSSATIQEINSGSLQRIAIAVEMMCRNVRNLEDECASYKERYARSQERGAERDRQIAALRGVITKMKRARA